MKTPLFENMQWIKYWLNNQLKNLIIIFDKVSLRIATMILILICLNMKNIYKNMKKPRKIYYILLIKMKIKIMRNGINLR